MALCCKDTPFRRLAGLGATTDGTPSTASSWGGAVAGMLLLGIGGFAAWALLRKEKGGRRSHEEYRYHPERLTRREVY